MPNACNRCGSTAIEFDESSATNVCTSCATVLEEDIIVSEIQFDQTAGGGCKARGQQVSGDDGPYQRENRSVTLANGKRTIMRVAQHLRLPQRCIDQGFNFFKLAVVSGLTRGRRHELVVGACLYISCRKDQAPFVLLDFCDALQINVYDLGKAYLRLCVALKIEPPCIEPCMYIVRFAEGLQLGDKREDVIKTATCLMKHMQDDWIHVGRRPAGVCGAALLMAARMHDFNRTIKDIIKVVRVCTATVRKRLTEFGETPSGQLSLNEFMTTKREQFEDPPAFKASQLKARLQELEERGKDEEATEKMNEFYNEIERHLDRKKRMTAATLNLQSAAVSTTPGGILEVDVNQEAQDTLRFVELETFDTIKNFVNSDDRTTPPLISIPGSPNTMVAGCSSNSLDWRSSIQGLGPTAASLGLKDSIQECLKVTEPVSEKDDGVLDLTGIDDEELDGYIMTADEAMRKSNLWHMMNADYLKEQKEREESQAAKREEDAKKPPKRKRKPRKKVGEQTEARTAEESLGNMLKETGISNKINYDVLRSITGGCFGSPSSSGPVSARGAVEIETVIETETEIETVIETETFPRPSRPIAIYNALERRRLQASRKNSKGFNVPIAGIIRRPGKRLAVNDPPPQGRSGEKRPKVDEVPKLVEVIEDEPELELVIEYEPDRKEGGSPKPVKDLEEKQEDEEEEDAGYDMYTGYGGAGDGTYDCDDYFD